MLACRFCEEVVSEVYFRHGVLRIARAELTYNQSLHSVCLSKGMESHSPPPTAANVQHVSRAVESLEVQN
jgi:hypothetical protein